MVFITGATGLLGSYIARKFVSEGRKVRCLRRKDSSFQLVEDFRHQIEWVEGDLDDILLLQQQLQGVEIIIHAAAVVSFSPSKETMMQKVNIEGTANLVNAALLEKVKCFLHVSSVAALGRVKEHEPIDESSIWVDGPSNSFYAKTKYLAELEVWRGAEEGLKTIVINPSVILGAGDIHKSSTQLFSYVLKEKLFFPGGMINYVDVRDVARIVYALINSDIKNERFIVNAGTISYKDFFEKIGKAMNKRSPFIPAGPLLGNLAWRLAKLQSLWSRKEPVLTKETSIAAQKSYYYKGDKLQQKLNFKYTDLENTIRWVADSIENSRL